MNPSNKERFMYGLAGAVLVVCVVGLVLPMLIDIPDASHDVTMLAIGIVLGWGTTVVGYFFGSSKSSADKTELLSTTKNQP